MEELLKKIKEEIKNITDLKSLNELKIKYLSKKGPINELSLKMKDLSIEEKKEYGMKLNAFKN